MFWKRQNPVDELIARMLSDEDAEPQTGGVIDSSKTVSWRAYREAESLRDTSWIKSLMQRIEHETDKNVRDAAYFILGTISKNTSDTAAVQFLIDRAYLESNRHVSAAIYDQLADIPKPPGTDISTIKRSATDDDWRIRHSAIAALGGCAEAEDILISISDMSDDPFDVVYANATLNRFGTTRAIATLEKHLKSRKRDVRDSAKLAIEEIKRRGSCKPE